MIFTVLVTRRVRYRIEADSPDAAHALAIAAALGLDARRTTGRVRVMAKTVVVDVPEMVDNGATPVVE